jgi:hypothetical protein
MFHKHASRQALSGDRKQGKFLFFLLMEKYFFLTYFFIGGYPISQGTPPEAAEYQEVT